MHIFPVPTLVHASQHETFKTDQIKRHYYKVSVSDFECFVFFILVKL